VEIPLVTQTTTRRAHAKCRIALAGNSLIGRFGIDRRRRNDGESRRGAGGRADEVADDDVITALVTNLGAGDAISAAILTQDRRAILAPLIGERRFAAYAYGECYGTSRGYRLALWRSDNGRRQNQCEIVIDCGCDL